VLRDSVTEVTVSGARRVLLDIGWAPFPSSQAPTNGTEERNEQEPHRLPQGAGVLGLPFVWEPHTPSFQSVIGYARLEDLSALRLVVVTRRPVVVKLNSGSV
jgi:hypothetical protein